MIEILSNGSKWYGQKPDTLEQLIDVLGEYALDPTFEKYGNFVMEYKPLKWTEKNSQYKGCASFFGNFYSLSHVFRIITDELEIIERITAAIRANQHTEAYRLAKIEYEEHEKQKDLISKQQINKLRYGYSSV